MTLLFSGGLQAGFPGMFLRDDCVSGNVEPSWYGRAKVHLGSSPCQSGGFGIWDPILICVDYHVILSRRYSSWRAPIWYIKCALGQNHVSIGFDLMIRRSSLLLSAMAHLLVVAGDWFVFGLNQETNKSSQKWALLLSEFNEHCGLVHGCLQVWRFWSLLASD